MPGAGEWLAAQWADLAGPALAALTGAKIQLAPEAGAPPPEAGEMLSWRQGVDVAPEAAVWVLAGSREWRSLGALVLQAAGLDDAADDELRGTYLEALQQALSPLGNFLGRQARREVTLASGVETEPPEGIQWISLRLTNEQVELGRLYVAVSESFTQWWDSLVAAASAAPAPAAPPQALERAAPARPVVAEGSRTLDLLLEVELPVGVSFGRTQMKVKDAIKLTTGSIVELNRNVSAPVEVIVNNCVIARGEVVVVEGNYGVRIQEIISREDRLRTLF